MERNGRAGDRGDGVHGLEDSDALISAGHRVAGSARSDESAWKLKERGIQAVKGNTADAGSLREAARGADAVAHAALMHDEGAEEAECTVVRAVLDVLWDTGRTSAYNSGVWVTRDTPEGVDLAEAASRAGDADGKVEA